MFDHAGKTADGVDRRLKRRRDLILGRARAAPDDPQAESCAA